MGSLLRHLRRAGSGVTLISAGALFGVRSAGAQASRPHLGVTTSAAPTSSIAVTAAASASAPAPSASPTSPPAITTTLTLPTPIGMTLPDALIYARAHQPSIEVARARIASAQARARVPEGQWTPQIGALAELLGGTTNGTTTSYVSDSAIDIARVSSTPVHPTGTFHPYPSSLVGVGVRQELFDFGRISAQTVALDRFVDVARADERVVQLDLDLAVREAFFSVQGAKEIVATADAAYTRTLAHRDLAKAGVEHQLRPPIELTRAEADLARFEVDRIRARGSLAQAQSVLAASIAYPTPLVDAVGDVVMSDQLPSLDSAVAAAQLRDPIVKAALAQLAGQEATTKAIHAELRPDISLSGTLIGSAGGTPLTTTSTPAGSGFLPVVPNWDVGILLSWPITDGVVSARADASHTQEVELRGAVAQRTQEEVAQIQSAWFAVLVAQAALPALEHEVAAAEANYAQADARFRAGLATAVEVADAEAVLTDAQIQRTLGRFAVAHTRAVFARAIAEGT